jgi:hypothetical protein
MQSSCQSLGAEETSFPLSPQGKESKGFVGSNQGQSDISIIGKGNAAS